MPPVYWTHEDLMCDFDLLHRLVDASALVRTAADFITVGIVIKYRPFSRDAAGIAGGTN